MDGEEEDLEAQLRQQLEEQQTALASLQEMQADGEEEPAELQEMRATLAEAIAELEEALREVVDSKRGAQEAEGGATGDPGIAPAVGLPPWVAVGSQVRFRSTSDGQWYAGRVTDLAGDMAAVVYYAPTNSQMLEPTLVPAASLRPARSTAPAPDQLQPGSRVYVRPQALPPSLGGLRSQQLWVPGQVQDVHELEGQVRVQLDTLPTSSGRQQQHQASGEGAAPQAGVGLGEQAGGEAGTIGQQGGGLLAGQAAGSSLQGQQAVPVIQVSLEDVVEGAWAGCSDLSDGSSSSRSDGSSSDGSSGSSDEEDSDRKQRALDGEEALEHSGLGTGLDVMRHARLAVAAGITTGYAHFADFESHSRGIASKLLARMGYVKGQGLGRQGHGMSAALEVVLRPSKLGLGAGRGEQGGGDGDGEGGEGHHHHGHHKKRKKKRGGERSRKKKHAAERRSHKEAKLDEQAKKEAKGGAPGLFAFINTALGDTSEAAGKIREMEASMLRQDRVSVADGGNAGPAGKAKGQQQQPATRKHLMDQQGRVEAAQAKVAHFAAMLERNKANPGLAPQIARKLEECKKELAAAEQQHSRLAKALRGADESRKMKF